MDKVDPPESDKLAIRRQRNRTTIRDVANASGYSIGTVSKALNNIGSLRADTRAKITAAAEALGFQPNDLAHSLHRGKTFTVGLISNDNFGRFSMPIMEGLEERLSDNRISVFMCNAADDSEREALHVRSLLKKRVDGIVVTARRVDIRRPLSVESAGMPIIYAFSQPDDPLAHCVLPDDAGGAAIATAHLAGLGRRKIAHVTGPERFQAVRDRRDGFRRALGEAGLFESDGYYLNGAWSEQWGREAVSRLFAAGRAAPDAIFCGSDQIARGVADALREQGIAIPADVALVGFDNWDLIAEATRPSLTTVDMNLRELGMEAGRRLIEMIAGAGYRGIVRTPATLVVRDSCGAKRMPDSGPRMNSMAE